MPQDTAVGAEDLLEGLLERVGALADSRAARIALLSSRRDDLVEMCRGARNGIVSLDADPTPRVATVAVDGAHVAEVDRGEAFSVSVAFALDSDGTQRSRACLAGLPHMTQMSDVSTGLMFMQEVVLAVEMAEASDYRGLVLVDGSRLSTLVAIDAFYRGLGDYRPGTLQAWRDDADSDVGRLLRLFEEEDWLSRYLLLPNVIANTKLVTTRRLQGELVALLDAGDPLARVLRDVDDKTLANVVLAPAIDSPGEGMGPFPSPMPRSPFSVRARDENGDGYPRSDEILSALEYLRADGRSPSGFNSFYLNPTASHGAFSVEVNNAFWGSRLADALAEGREGDARTRLLRGLAAFVRDETPSVDIQEPYLTHVADRLCKRTVVAAKNAYSFVLQADGFSDLGWTLTRSHRTTT